MSIALVQQVPTYTAFGGSADKTITITVPSAGNALRLQLGCSSSQTINSVSGGGVTWSQVATQSELTGGIKTEIWAGDNSSGSGTTITINVSNTYSRVDAVFTEWSGMPTTPVADGGPTGNTGRSVTASTASITPTAGKEVLILATAQGSGAVTNAGPTGGFTALTLAGSNSGLVGFAYQIVGSASGSYSTSWTVAHSYDYWATLIAGWDGAAAAGYINPQFPLRFAGGIG
jgi:hypothetical protein